MKDLERRGSEGGLNFRLAARDDIPATVAVLNRTFRTPMDEATWEWYLYGNPFGVSRVYLAIEAETEAIAGVFAFTPLPLRLRGVSTMGSSGHHLCLTRERHGGTALIALSRYALAGETDHGVVLAIGLPNRRSHQPQKVLMKWIDLCVLDCLFKLSPAARQHNCKPLDRFDAGFDRFYGRLQQRFEFLIDKNAAWMNWRFCDRPGRPYTVAAVECGGELAGYAVLKRWREPDGYTKAHIVDLHALDEVALDELLTAAESYAAGCNELNLWSAPGFPYRRFLEAHGFSARAEGGQPLIAKALGNVALHLDGPAGFSYADGDFVY